MSKINQPAELPETKRKLVAAGVSLMRRQGFNATTVDDICASAGVTKGGFFHYFKSKQDLAKAAIIYFTEGKTQEFQEAPFRKLADPLDRVFGRLDFIREANSGTGRVTRGCLFGMFAQELSFTNPELRVACQESFARVIADFQRDLAEAKSAHLPQVDFDPKSVAMLFVSILQGSLILAKVSEANAVLLENIEQFRAYLQSLFGVASSRSHN
jgi:TetR/AcrR family transcriptional repressor of nem operon